MDPNNTESYGMNLPTAMTVAAFCGITWMNTIELEFRVWLGFKRRSGLYFWSLVFSSLGCTLQALGFLFLDFDIVSQPLAAGAILSIGWYLMVTGQSLVLYSRLHLVVRDTRILRWVLGMIITDVFILHFPSTVFGNLSYASVPNQQEWARVYKIYEKIQMTGFTIQESVISGIYLYESYRMLGARKLFQRERSSRVLRNLIYINIFILFLDLTLLTTEYLNLFSIQTVFKTAIYTVKLRFELVILNQLLDMVSSNRNCNMPNSSNTAKKLCIFHNKDKHNPSDGECNRQGSCTYFVSASRAVDIPRKTQDADIVLKTSEIRVSSSKMGHEDHGDDDTTQLCTIGQGQVREEEDRPITPRVNVSEDLASTLSVDKYHVEEGREIPLP